MKAISRNNITKVIEYCYFKDLSCGKTAKLLKIGKTSVANYYKKFKESKVKYSELIILSNEEFFNIFYDKHTNTKCEKNNRKKQFIFDFLDKNYDVTKNITQDTYWNSYKILTQNHYSVSQFKKYFKEWIDTHEINYDSFPNKITLDKLSSSDILELKKFKKTKNKNHWKKAKAILDLYKGIPKQNIEKNLEISHKVLKRWIQIINEKGVEKLFEQKHRPLNPLLEENIRIKKSRIIKLLHQTPSLYNINRTSWRREDLAVVYKQIYNESIGASTISDYLKQEGYRFKKARKVLTSPDPKFREKLDVITEILSNLKDYEKFFSVDEFGPFAIKMQGGRTYSKKGEEKTVPQLQKSKGSLIMTAALELSTNQMTHFYSEHKNTDEMIKLMYILIEQYKDQKKLYLSWDAASWHISKKLQDEVEKVNELKKLPKVYLAPLPSCAQFLNVIESVFSGMARAIIHNSNYKSIDECKKAIDKYYQDRNEYFKNNPKKAGNKIWGKEVVPPVFSLSNNCKDPRFR